MIVNILNYFQNFCNGWSKFIQIRTSPTGSVLSTTDCLHFLPFFLGRGGGRGGGEWVHIILEKSNCFKGINDDDDEDEDSFSVSKYLSVCRANWLHYKSVKQRYTN